MSKNNYQVPRFNSSDQKQIRLDNMRKKKKQSNNKDEYFRKLSQDSSEFSFSKGPLQTEKISIRSDLHKLPKQDIIQILLQQIEETKVLRIKLSSMQEQCKLMSSFRQDNYSLKMNNSGELIPMTKYKELSDYMEEYISNTNEAQDHFMNLINQLKASNNKYREQNTKLQNNIYQMIRQRNQLSFVNEDKHKIQQLQKIIKNLEDSVSHYMNINNQNTRKYQKLKKMYEMMQQQLQTAMHSEDRSLSELHVDSNKKSIYRNGVSSVKKSQNQKQNLEQKIKILQIQNHELKQSWSSMERTLQSKSDKIRKLLQDIQRLSEQKWIYKQKYMELKTKSLVMTTQSCSKTYQFDSQISQIQNETHIGDFQFQK